MNVIIFGSESLVTVDVFRVHLNLIEGADLYNSSSERSACCNSNAIISTVAVNSQGLVLQIVFKLI